MFEVNVPADVEHLDEILEYVSKALNDIGADAKFNNNIYVAVEEIFVNIAHYAYPSGEGNVTVSAVVKNNNITIKFVDSGIPYNPLESADLDTTLSAEERSIGGLGIFMVKSLMDTMDYTYENNTNILTISKQWSGNV